MCIDSTVEMRGKDEERTLLVLSFAQSQYQLCISPGVVNTCGCLQRAWMHPESSAVARNFSAASRPREFTSSSLGGSCRSGEARPPPADAASAGAVATCGGHQWI